MTLKEVLTFRGSKPHVNIQGIKELTSTLEPRPEGRRSMITVFRGSCELSSSLAIETGRLGHGTITWEGKGGAFLIFPLSQYNNTSLINITFPPSVRNKTEFFENCLKDIDILPIFSNGSHNCFNDTTKSVVTGQRVSISPKKTGKNMRISKNSAFSD